MNVLLSTCCWLLVSATPLRLRLVCNVTGSPQSEAARALDVQVSFRSHAHPFQALLATLSSHLCPSVILSPRTHSFIPFGLPPCHEEWPSDRTLQSQDQVRHFGPNTYPTVREPPLCQRFHNAAFPSTCYCPPPHIRRMSQSPSLLNSCAYIRSPRSPPPQHLPSSSPFSVATTCFAFASQAFRPEASAHVVPDRQFGDCIHVITQCVTVL